MKDAGRPSSGTPLLEIGAAGAILGAIVSVAAGMGFGNLTNEVGTVEVLRAIAARPSWYWPAVHCGFILGAFLWVAAFVGIACTLESGLSSALGRLGVAAILVGAAVHVVDSSVSGFGLAALAGEWTSAAGSEREGLVQVGDTLLYGLRGTWRSVHSFFHGLPFILAGAAVAVSGRYPAWLGWLGAVGGAGSLLGGMLQFFAVLPGDERRLIVFAQAVSLWMVAMGVLVWRRAATMRASARR